MGNAGELDRRIGDRPVLVFDGECNLCNRAAQFVLDHDRRGRVLLCASQSESGRALLASGPKRGAPAEPVRRPDETIFLIEGERIDDKSTAALRLCRALGFPWSLLAVLGIVPRAMRDLVYDLVARNRYRWFGRRESCRMARPGEAERFLP
jgi:predicted DCC family thiol-disulfide oxidoreductase YuxK